MGQTSTTFLLPDHNTTQTTSKESTMQIMNNETNQEKSVFKKYLLEILLMVLTALVVAIITTVVTHLGTSIKEVMDLNFKNIDTKFEKMDLKFENVIDEIKENRKAVEDNENSTNKKLKEIEKKLSSGLTNTKKDMKLSLTSTRKDVGSEFNYVKKYINSNITKIDELSKCTTKVMINLGYPHNDYRNLIANSKLANFNISKQTQIITTSNNRGPGPHSFKITTH